MADKVPVNPPKNDMPKLGEDLDVQEVQSPVANDAYVTGPNRSPVKQCGTPKLALRPISKQKRVSATIARAKELNIYYKFSVLKHNLMKK